jgi:hypothetical protein
VFELRLFERDNIELVSNRGVMKKSVSFAFAVML